MAPYFLQQRDALCRRVQKQKAKNQDLADAVLAGRRQLEGLQQQIQALQQTWQASVWLCLFPLVWLGGFLSPSLRDPMGAVLLRGPAEVARASRWL